MNKEQAEKIYNEVKGLENFAVDTMDVVLDRIAVFQVKAQDIGVDLFASKDIFLDFIAYIGDKMWDAGILEPVDGMIVRKSSDVILSMLFGKDWFEKAKSRLQFVTVENNRIVVNA